MLVALIALLSWRVRMAALRTAVSMAQARCDSERQSTGVIEVRWLDLSGSTLAPSRVPQA